MENGDVVGVVCIDVLSRRQLRHEGRVDLDGPAVVRARGGRLLLEGHPSVRQLTVGAVVVREAMGCRQEDLVVDQGTAARELLRAVGVTEVQRAGLGVQGVGRSVDHRRGGRRDERESGAEYGSGDESSHGCGGYSQVRRAVKESTRLWARLPACRRITDRWWLKTRPSGWSRDTGDGSSRSPP